LTIIFEFISSIVRRSCGVQIKQVGLLWVLWFPPTLTQTSMPAKNCLRGITCFVIVVK